MKSEWKVMSNTINGKKVYGVYRLRDVNAVDHSGSREMRGGYMVNREEADALAEILNRVEES